MMCSGLHCQKGFNLIRLAYEIKGALLLFAHAPLAHGFLHLRLATPRLLQPRARTPHLQHHAQFHQKKVSIKMFLVTEFASQHYLD